MRKERHPKQSYKQMVSTPSNKLRLLIATSAASLFLVDIHEVDAFSPFMRPNSVFRNNFRPGKGFIDSNRRRVTPLWHQTDDDNDDQILPPTSAFDDDDLPLNKDELKQLTVVQLQQQLRLRGKKVGGRKAELIKRLLGKVGVSNIDEDDVLIPDIIIDKEQIKKSKARQFADSHGKELIDVTDYLEETDKGKTSKSTHEKSYLSEENSGDGKVDSSPETWGNEAKIVEDYEGRSVVVDGLSRTVVEFKGSKKEKVRAYVSASRDSLKAYLAGGEGRNATELEALTQDIQLRREKASRVPMRLEDVQGEDQDDEEGYYTNILDRDYGDFGRYSTTGVQLSAQEVKGVLLLPDVYGPFSDDMQRLADTIAFETQPVVVFAPDIFRGNPWSESADKPGYDNEGNSYEDWRSTHDDQRVSVDIRAAAAALREQYGVSSISIFGACFGGGRALEAACRAYPHDSTDDVDGEDGPDHVNPTSCIAWYPTRYSVESIFGKKRENNDEEIPKMAVMAIFASEDTIPGATPTDAAALQSCLEEDDKVIDNMVKIFPGQVHGFAHKGTHTHEETENDRFLDDEFGGIPSNGLDGGDAEVACLLSTAWMETYSRSYLPTIGDTVRGEDRWTGLEMPDLSESRQRDIRGEIDDALNSHEDVDVDLKRMHPDDFKTPIDDLEHMDDQLSEALKTESFGISLEDDADVFLDKLEAALERGDFSSLPGVGEIPLDGSGEGYW